MSENPDMGHPVLWLDSRKSRSFDYAPFGRFAQDDIRFSMLLPTLRYAKDGAPGALSAFLSG